MELGGCGEGSQSAVVKRRQPSLCTPVQRGGGHEARMPDPNASSRFDVYRNAREPSRFLTVPAGSTPRDVISRDTGVQVLDFLLFAGAARIDAIAGFRCDVEAVRRDVEREGYALHRGIAAVPRIAPPLEEDASQADALSRRASVLRERTAAWRHQLAEKGEAWDGYCHTLAAAIALEERAMGLEERAEAARERDWAA